MRNLLPLFIDLAGREVLLVGGGPVAAGKLRQLQAAGATVHVVAPEVIPAIEVAARDGRVRLERRAFQPSDLDGVWLAVAAAPPAVNREVAAAADARRVFVNAADDLVNASAFLSGVVRRDGVTIAISTSGDAPALTSLVREALERVLPEDLAEWMQLARRERAAWRRTAEPLERRKPLLLEALNERYRDHPAHGMAAAERTAASGAERVSAQSTEVPWLHAPEDSWL